MPYLGRELTSGNYLKLDDISSQFDGSTTTFQLKSGGSDFFPGSSFSLLVSVGGVIQEADSAYQINSNEITFASAPSNGDDCFIIVLGLALAIGIPGDGTVGNTQLQSNSVGSAEIQSGAVGLDELSETAKLNVSKNSTLVGSAVTEIDFKGTGISTTQYNSTVGIATIFVDQGSNLGVTTSIGLGAGTTISTGNLQTINFAGPGVSTGYYNAGVGIATIFFEGGGGSSVGAAGTWASDSVGVATSKVVGVGTATAVGTANSEGALQSLGNIAITDGALLIDNDISSSINVPSGKNGLLIGTVSVAVGATIDVATGSVLVVV